MGRARAHLTNLLGRLTGWAGVLVVVGAMWAAGCSCSRRDDAQGAAIPKSLLDRDKSLVPPAFYDTSGKLLESKNQLAGLPLPVGLEEPRVDGRKHVYRVAVATEKVTEYFMARLIPEVMQPRGKGAEFTRAKYAKGPDDDPQRFDVLVVPAGGGTLVQINVIPTVEEIRKKGRTDAELMKQYEELMKKGL